MLIVLHGVIVLNFIKGHVCAINLAMITLVIAQMNLKQVMLLTDQKSFIVRSAISKKSFDLIPELTILSAPRLTVGARGCIKARFC